MPAKGDALTVPRLLTIAGSDSGGGAGIQADLKAFAAAGAHGMSAIVALTAQSTVGVRAVHEVPPEFIVEQLTAVFSDIGVDAVKTGMLSSRRVIGAVAGFLAEERVPSSSTRCWSPRRARCYSSRTRSMRSSRSSSRLRRS
jgi:hydroxymethylpyrimidine/phosphomethylpyrimidine kinase